MNQVSRWWITGAIIALCLTFGILLETHPTDATPPSLPLRDGYVEETAESVPPASGEQAIREELEAAGFADVPENVITTLSTLEKLDEYPVYTMHYVGPYVHASDLASISDAERESVALRSDWACSLFAALGNAEQPLFGRNFDWDHSPILILFLEPDVGYRSIMSIDIAYLVDEETIDCLDTAPAESLIPLLNAPFLTFDGINEKGVAIGMASVDYECGYPTDPEKRDVGDLRLMREVLESSATVEEAVAFLEGIDPVSQGGPNTHYLIADRTPAAALIEYHEGEMHVLRSTVEKPWELGTNFPVVLTEGDPGGRCWRYDRIAQTLEKSVGDLSLADAMALLQEVSTDMTQWSIVYDLGNLTMDLVVDRRYDNVHTFSLLQEDRPALSSTAADSPTAQEAAEQAGAPGSVSRPIETWTRTYGDEFDRMAHDVLLLDAGYLLLGDTVADASGVPHLTLMKLDDDGEVVWERTYAEGRASSGGALLAAHDGGFVIAGTIQSDDGDDADVWLLRLDEDGTEQWSRIFGTSRNEFGGRLLGAANGDYIIIGNSVDPSDIVADASAAGYAGFDGRSNAYIVRTDKNGNELWARRYDTEDNVIASGGAIDDDGGIVVLSHALHYPVDDNDIRLFKLDGDGNETWSRAWEEGKTSGYDFAATSDGGYLISGMQAFPEDPQREKSDALLIKVDGDGRELWSTTFGEPSKIETAHAVTETFDGQYVCVGWQTQAFSTQNDNIYLVGFDKSGSLQWESVIPTAKHNMHEALVQHPDGSLVIAGSATLRGRAFHMQLIKIMPPDPLDTDG